MRWLLMVATLVAALALMMSAIAMADSNLPNIGAHRHFIKTPSGQLKPIGPDLCDNLDNAGIQMAFNQFHSNIHRAVDGSEGPTQAAPGLHNVKGGELVFMAGCGTQ